MHYQSTLKPTLTSQFKDGHPHKHFQLCLIEFEKNGAMEEFKTFLSCPETGLTQVEINSFLVNELSVDPEMNPVEEGEEWYWADQESYAVRLSIVGEDGEPAQSCPIYSIEDPELQLLASRKLVAVDYSI